MTTETCGEAIAAQFTRNLLANPEVMAHVAGRGIKRTTVESGYVGFCPPYAEHWFPLLKGRIIIPIRSVHGDIVAFAGRRYEPMADLTIRALWERFGDKPADAQRREDKWLAGKWINEPYSKIKHLYFLDFAKKAAREKGYIILVEGYLDAVVGAQCGFWNIAALCGTALSEWHCALIGRYCRTVVLMLDGDDAGDAASKKMMPRLREAGMKVCIVTLPPGKDPDEYFLANKRQDILSNIERAVRENKAILNL